jgi:fatty-acid desaturase
MLSRAAGRRLFLSISEPGAAWMAEVSTAAGHAHGAEEEFHDDIIYPGSVPFVLVHLACLGAVWTGVTPGVLVLCIALYVVRMFGVTAGYHRYF